MNKEQLKTNIEEMKKRLASMEAELAKIESKVWEPEEGETVYLLDIAGYFVRAIHNNFLHYKLWLMGNVFRTEAEAIKERDKRLATMRVIRKFRELEGDLVADCSDKYQSKFTIYYEHKWEKFKTTCWGTTQNQDNSLYSTKEACQYVIDNMADDLRLMFDVEVE